MQNDKLIPELLLKLLNFDLSSGKIDLSSGQDRQK